MLTGGLGGDPRKTVLKPAQNFPGNGLSQGGPVIGADFDEPRPAPGGSQYLPPGGQEWGDVNHELIHGDGSNLLGEFTLHNDLHSIREGSRYPSA